MTKRRANIAVLLCGIFLFPIIFQSVHIVWHHSHGFKCEHHHCQQIAPHEDFHSYFENISDEVSKCPICDYQFPVNNLPEVSFLGTLLPLHTCIYIELNQQSQYKQVFSDKTPRAPPTFKL